MDRSGEAAFEAEADFLWPWCAEDVPDEVEDDEEWGRWLFKNRRSSERGPLLVGACEAPSWCAPLKDCECVRVL